MITQEDLAKYRAFKALVIQGDFKLEGKAVLVAASLFDWFNKLEKKLQACQAIKMEEVEEPIKPLVEPEA